MCAIQVLASDHGEKAKDSKSGKKEHVKKNTKEDIGAQAQLQNNDHVSYSNYDESVESMASWHISQSIPKPEKVSKKEEQQQVKLDRKIIRQEKKACRKLKQSRKKDHLQSY